MYDTPNKTLIKMYDTLYMGPRLLSPVDNSSWRRIFKTVILEFEEHELPQVISRELKVKEHNVVSIIGPRRAGKTYYFYQLIKELKERKQPVLYLNFEHELLSGLDARYLREALIAFRELYGVKPRYVFLDEIQVVENWEKFVRRLYDEGEYRVYLTGSSSKMLAKEIASSLRGRTITYTLLPFSFREYLRARNIGININLIEYTEERGRILYILREYLEKGGFPEPVLKPELYNELLASIRDGIFYRDIVERHDIRRPQILSILVRMLAEKYSRYYTITKLYNTLKSMGLRVSKSTIHEYLQAVEDALFFFNVYLLRNPIQEAVKSPRKIFIVDTGLLNIYGVKKELPKLMENVVYLDLLRRQNIDPLVNINYWKDERGNEVDFVIRKGVKVQELIQVTYELTPDNARREIRPLIKASKKLEVNKLTIITWDQEDEIIQDNRVIEVKPLWKWLITFP